jgi:hypothetical protein
LVEREVQQALRDFKRDTKADNEQLKALIQSQGRPSKPANPPSVEELSQPPLSPIQIKKHGLHPPSGFQQHFPMDDPTLQGLAYSQRQAHLVDPDLLASMLHGGGFQPPLQCSTALVMHTFR